MKYFAALYLGKSFTQRSLRRSSNRRSSFCRFHKPLFCYYTTFMRALLLCPTHHENMFTYSLVQSTQTGHYLRFAHNRNKPIRSHPLLQRNLMVDQWQIIRQIQLVKFLTNFTSVALQGPLAGKRAQHRVSELNTRAHLDREERHPQRRQCVLAMRNKLI